MQLHIRFALAALLAIATASGPAFASEELRVARYTTVQDNELRDLDPLQITATINFPREFVASVGDALSYLLQRSGYSLTAGDKDAERLLGLPLPESHRSIGPRKVSNIARTLIGEAFGLCVNQTTRELAVAAIGNQASCLATQLRGE